MAAGPPQAVIEALERQGFRKRAGDVLTCSLDGNEILGWVGLNRASHRTPGRLDIGPVIGVRHQPVERLIAKLRNSAFHQYNPPSASQQLGYLMPSARYTSWTFSNGPADQVEATTMADAIATYGRPFIDANRSIEGLLETLISSQRINRGQAIYRIPAAHLVAGNAEAAARFLEEELARQASNDDLAARAFRAFADAMQAELGGSIVA